MIVHKALKTLLLTRNNGKHSKQLRSQ